MTELAISPAWTVTGWPDISVIHGGMVWCAVGSAAPIAASSPRRGPNNGAIMRPVGPSNKGGQAGAAQGPHNGQHLGGKGPVQPPVSPSAGTAVSDQSLGRSGSGNDVSPSADAQYGLGYGMAQPQPQQGYSTPLVSKVSLETFTAVDWTD